MDFFSFSIPHSSSDLPHKEELTGTLVFAVLASFLAGVASASRSALIGERRWGSGIQVTGHFALPWTTQGIVRTVSFIILVLSLAAYAQASKIIHFVALEPVEVLWERYDKSPGFSATAVVCVALAAWAANELGQAIYVRYISTPDALAPVVPKSLSSRQDVVSALPSASSKDKRKAMLRCFDHLVTSVLKDFRTDYELPVGAEKWLDRMMRYTVPGGKMNRGVAVVDAASSLSDTPLTARQAYEARVMGWCVEWLQAYFLVADDLMDSSKTRRGQKCWYRVPEVGLIAVNDGIILEQVLFCMLRKELSHRPYYTAVIDLFHEVTTQTALGQLLDLTTQPPPPSKFLAQQQGGEENNGGSGASSSLASAASPDLDRFTMERWRLIVTYKTAFYTFYLPVALGIHAAGKGNPRTLRAVRDVCIDLGVYFQAQDDFLDCFGDPKVRENCYLYLF